MRHSTFSSGSSALVVSILLCTMHQLFDCRKVALDHWLLNSGYPAICDYEYRQRYFNDRLHKEAIRAGLLYVPPDDPYVYAQSDTEDASYSVELPIIENNHASEYLPTDFDSVESGFIEHPSSKSVEDLYETSPDTDVWFSMRRHRKPIARNVSELHDLQLRSKEKRLRAFVNKMLRKLERNNAVAPEPRPSRTDDFLEGKIRSAVSQKRKFRNILKVDKVFAGGKFCSRKSWRRQLRNRDGIEKVFGNREMSSPKRRGQFGQTDIVGARFHAKTESVDTKPDDLPGKQNISNTVKIFWSQDTCKDSRRIVGGRDVDASGYLPYMAFVDTGCGGSIIGNEWVLTAAHCVDRDQVDHVHVGDFKLMTGCQYTVDQLFIHPRYSRKMLVADIALLHVTPAFIFSRSIRPVPLSSSKAVKRTCGTVAGWGAAKFKGAMRSILKTTRIPVVSRKKCRQWGISRRQFCAGYDDGYSDTCQGDSGGPFVVNGIQVGIVSYGYKCAELNKPGIYVDVSYFRDWIRSITGF